MENYEFKVKKIITNTVEVKAENYNQALVKVLDLLLFKDKEIFEEAEEKDIDFDVILEKIKCENDLKSIQNIKEILKKIEEKNSNSDEKIDKKCENCILREEYFTS